MPHVDVSSQLRMKSSSALCPENIRRFLEQSKLLAFHFPASGFCLVSPGFLVPINEVFVHMLYNNLFVSFRDLWRSVAETEDTYPALGINEVGWDFILIFDCFGSSM